MTKFHQDDYVDVIQYVFWVMDLGWLYKRTKSRDRENSRALQNQPMGVALEIEI